MKKYPLLYVQWNDAESHADWANKRSVNRWSKKRCIIHEIGWLIQESDEHIVLSNQISPYDIGNRTKIPKGMIIKRSPLKEIE